MTNGLLLKELKYAKLRIGKVKDLVSKKNKTPEEYKELNSQLYSLNLCINWLIAKN